MDEGGQHAHSASPGGGADEGKQKCMRRGREPNSISKSRQAGVRAACQTNFKETRSGVARLFDFVFTWDSRIKASMNSNENPESFGRWSDPPRRPMARPFPHTNEWSPGGFKPRLEEDTLKQGLVQIERKTFVFTLKENMRGRLLRITEDIGGRRNSIIIPSTGLKEFKELLEEMIKAADELPPEKKTLD